MGHLIIGCTLLLFFVLQHAGAPVSYTDAAERASELLARTRAALGGENLINDITGLSASISVRRKTGSTHKQDEKHTLKVVVCFPNKFWKQTIDPYKNPVNNRDTYMEAFNGEQWWSKPPRIAFSTDDTPHSVRAGDFERSRECRTSMAQQELTWYTFTLLFRIMPQGSITFFSNGSTLFEGTEADLFTVAGFQDRFIRFLLAERLASGSPSIVLQPQSTLSLVLDQRTHLPLGLQFNVLETLEAPSITGQRTVRAIIRFSDYRPVQGLLIPHRITTIFGEKVIEELRVNKFELNPKVDPGFFDPPGEQSPH